MIATIAPRMTAEGASGHVARLSPGRGTLAVAAVVNHQSTELRARWGSRQRFGNVRPADAAVARHVTRSGRI